MFEAAIFDWDGTLADTRRIINISFQTALAEINCQVSQRDIERRIGIGAAETFRQLLHLKNVPFGEDLIAELVEIKSQLEINLSGQVALFAGAQELVLSLQEKMKVALASMNNRSVILHMLKVLKLNNCFEVVLTTESVSLPKPNPELFQKTAEQLGVAASRCIVFEDSVFGVKAAKAAGMGCVGVTTGVYSMQELESEGVDLTVESLNNPKILRFIMSL
jgi:beta-phosphoglucomutase